MGIQSHDFTMQCDYYNWNGAFAKCACKGSLLCNAKFGCIVTGRLKNVSAWPHVDAKGSNFWPVSSWLILPQMAWHQWLCCVNILVILGDGFFGIQETMFRIKDEIDDWKWNIRWWRRSRIRQELVKFYQQNWFTALPGMCYFLKYETALQLYSTWLCVCRQPCQIVQ